MSLLNLLFVFAVGNSANAATIKNPELEGFWVGVGQLDEARRTQGGRCKNENWNFQKIRQTEYLGMFGIQARRDRMRAAAFSATTMSMRIRQSSSRVVKSAIFFREKFKSTSAMRKFQSNFSSIYTGKQI